MSVQANTIEPGKFAFTHREPLIGLKFIFLWTHVRNYPTAQMGEQTNKTSLKIVQQQVGRV